MAEIIQEEDEIRKSYTYEDWWVGRIFFGLWSQLSVDVYFDSTKKILNDPNFDHFDTHKLKNKFKAVPWCCLPSEELNKILAKQEELFYSDVEIELNILKDNFLKRFYKSDNKTRLLQVEFETYDKLFHEEKQPIGLRTNMITLDLGNRSWSTANIDAFRVIYHDRIVNGKKSFTSVNSPNSGIGIGNGHHQAKEVEAFAKYYNWILKFKSQLTFVAPIGKYFSYTFSESQTGLPPASKHQIVFREYVRNEDKSLSYFIPEEDKLTTYFFNKLFGTDALEIEDFLNFHYNQYSGDQTKWLRFVESRYEDWITDYQTQTKSLNPLNKYISAWIDNKINSTQSNLIMKKNPLEAFEIFLDMGTIFQAIDKLEKIKEQEDAEKHLGQMQSKRFTTPLDFQLWLFIYFRKEAEKIRQEFKSETQQFDNNEKIKAFINQQYGFIKAILKKSAQIAKTRLVNDEHKFVNTALHFELDSFKRTIEEEYETFLDNNDKHKVTFSDFEHEVLHRFSDYHKIIHIEKNEPSSAYLIHNLEEVEKAKPKKLLDFKKHYQHIVRNWIAYNKDLGNIVSEKEFIKFALNQFESLIKLDSETGNYLGEDHQMEKFEFVPEFYQHHLVPLLDSLKTFLESRLSHLDLSSSSKNQLPLLKWTRTDVDLLEFVTALQLSGAINNEAGNLNRTQAIDFFENLFGIKIKDAESKLSKATDRIKSKHPFLDELVKKFAGYCSEKDAHKTS